MNDEITKKAKHIVDKSPKLKAIKSASQGEKSMFHGSGKSSDAGKGSAPRTNINSQEWKDAYDQIDWTQLRTEKKNYRVKINGVYVDNDNET